MEDESTLPLHVAGQVHALTAFCLALIESHPAPRKLATQFDLALQAGLARTESELIPEEFLQGQNDVTARFLKALEKYRAA